MSETPPPDPSRERSLLGRRDELDLLRVLVGHARNGRGGSVLLLGDPGIGKTSLLEEAAAAARDVRLVSVAGYEAEVTMPFAAVQRLITPLSEHLDSLPKQHRQALRVACGTAYGPPPDRFLVGLGFLGLLAVAGEEAPVVCTIDDAHLLDTESLDVLAFAARRLEAESAVLLLAGRETDALMDHTGGVTPLRLEGLDAEAAVRLLMRSVRDPIDPTVAAKVARATGGNPLALVDLAEELTVTQLTESSFADDPLPIGRHLEQHYLRRVRLLDDRAQHWLLVAAVDSTGDIDLITMTAQELGLPAWAADRAEEAGFVTLGRSVRFRHPLIRSAAYSAATGKELRRVHRALAVIAAKLGNVERAAWHRAKSILGTDEDTAQSLELVADVAAERGGFASRARVLMEAAALSPSGGRRQARLVAAAEAALAAGSAQLAKQLIDDIDEDLLDPVSRGRLVVVRAEHSLFVAAPALTRGAAAMVEAADLFHGEDVDLEQRTLLKAWEYALPSERLTVGLTWEHLGVRLAAGAEIADGAAAAILRGISALILEPYDEAAPRVRQALDAYDAMDDDNLLAYGHGAVALATFLWDLDTRHRLLERWADVVRDAGALIKLDTALWVLSMTEAFGGTPRRAVQYMEQVRELRRAIGYDAEHVVNLAVLAWSTTSREQVTEIAEVTRSVGFGGVHSSAMAALATVDIAEGRYGEAYDRLEPFVEEPFLHVTATLWPDFAEAAAHSGRDRVARDAVTDLAHVAEVSGSDWARGLVLRSRAMLASTSRSGAATTGTTETVEDDFRAAIEVLEGTRATVDLGRSHLLLGEWLRRAKRRRDARPHLLAAAELFERAGVEPFAKRARRELDATGKVPHIPGPRRADQLTQQELTVAELAAAGRTNAEIARTTFLSANTVDYHLRKVFQKFGISSRRQLADRMADT